MQNCHRCPETSHPTILGVMSRDITPTCQEGRAERAKGALSDASRLVRTSEPSQRKARNFVLVKKTPSPIPDLWESASERSTQMNIILTTIDEDDDNIIRSDN